MTTTSDDEPNDARALTALAKLGREAVERPTTAELDRGLDALFAHITGQRVRRGRAVRWSLLGVAAAICSLVGLRMASVYQNRSSAAETPALAYRIEGGTVLEGGYLRDSGDAGIKLLFNDGSRVSLMRGARGRLRSVDKDGTRVVVDNGTASFQVARSREPRWLVEAGPFLVAVKGTLFTVSWDPSSERFELRLRHGRVVVSGPVTGGDIALRAGQRLVVNLPKAETLISEETPDQAAEDLIGAPVPQAVDSPHATPPVASELSPRASASAAPPASGSASKVEGKLQWADQLASGHWDRILEDVERAGVQATLDKASSEDLFALADAARYRRRTGLAREALLAQRRRFPSSPRSLDALFLLGRVEESGRGGRARAIALYDEYLARAATGAYAAEALGRKMILTNELHGRAEARPIAEEYLRRFPAGSYAGSARALCRVP